MTVSGHLGVSPLSASERPGWCMGYPPALACHFSPGFREKPRNFNGVPHALMLFCQNRRVLPVSRGGRAWRPPGPASDFLTLFILNLRGHALYIFIFVFRILFCFRPFSRGCAAVVAPRLPLRWWPATAWGGAG